MNSHLSSGPSSNTSAFQHYTLFSTISPLGADPPSRPPGAARAAPDSSPRPRAHFPALMPQSRGQAGAPHLWGMKRGTVRRPAQPDTAVCVRGRVEGRGAGRSPPLGTAPALAQLLATPGPPPPPALSHLLPPLQVRPPAARGPGVRRASLRLRGGALRLLQPHPTWSSGVGPERWLGLLLAGARVPSGSATRLL